MVVVLALCIAAGPLAVDQCLISCHAAPESSTRAAASPPHCHDAAQTSAGDRWQATAVCNHDHGVASAESTFKIRPGSPLEKLHAAVAERRDASIPSREMRSAISPGPPPGASGTAAFALPLRL
jgi:hypothetical protein